MVDIDREAIAKALGVPEGNWAYHMLPSGRSFNDMLSGTIGWLMADNYTMRYGSSPSQSVMLTTRGLQVMNAMPSPMPSPLKETVGTELRKATEKSSGSFDLSKLGDLIGGVIGGFTKSVGSG